MNPPPRRVLLIVTRRIGDVLLATPVLRSIKRAWPQTTIDALVFNGTAGVLAANPDIGQIHAVAERPGLMAHLAFIGRLFRRYDLAVSLLPGDRPTLYAFLAGRKRVGLLLATRKERWKQYLLDHWVAYDRGSKHMVLTHLSVLAPLGIPPAPDITVGWRDADVQRAAAALAPLDHRPYVVLHVYPRFNYKMWHDSGWIALAQWISERGLRVVLTGGDAAAEMFYVQRMASNVPEALNLAGQLTLNECACVLANATAYVGPDTALTHMAAALGVPMVALFGPTDPARWGPWPQGHVALENPWRRLGHQSCRHVRLVQGSAACAPCGHEGCDRHVDSFSDCLLHLPATEVINALSEVANIL